MDKVRRLNDRIKEDVKNQAFKKAFDEEEIYASIAIQIAKLREKYGLSQKGLAKRLHTTQQTISRLENQSNSSYSIGTLIKLAQTFNKDLQIKFV